MNKAIYLEPHQVPAHLRGGYDGGKFKAEVCEAVTIPSDAGVWGGGSRDTYSVINVATGQSIAAPGQQSAPWDERRRDYSVPLQPGVAVVRRSIFCGKDMGLTFYVHPDNAAQLLPAPTAELSDIDRLIIDATCGYKSSYNGKDRYQMAFDDAAKWDADARRYVAPGFPTRDEWNAAKVSLADRGYLNKAGAITPKGRNARTRP